MPKGLYQPQGSKADVVTSCPAFKIKSSLQIIFVSKEVICLAMQGQVLTWQEASLVGQNMFFHHMFMPAGIVVQ